MFSEKSKPNDALRIKGAEVARARSNEVARKIREAMAVSDQEIRTNEGIYPNGKLNQREICRRAGVHY